MIQFLCPLSSFWYEGWDAYRIGRRLVNRHQTLHSAAVDGLCPLTTGSGGSRMIVLVITCETPLSPYYSTYDVRYGMYLDVYDWRVRWVRVLYAHIVLHYAINNPWSMTGSRIDGCTNPQSSSNHLNQSIINHRFHDARATKYQYPGTRYLVFGIRTTSFSKKIRFVRILVLSHHHQKLIFFLRRPTKIRYVRTWSNCYCHYNHIRVLTDSKT